MFGAHVYFSQKKDRIQLLNKIEHNGLAKDKGPDSVSGKMRGALFTMMQRLGSFAKPTKEDEVSLLRKRFMQAGLSRMKNMMLIFYGSKVLLAIALPISFSILQFTMFRTMLPLKFTLVLISLALIGFYIPVFWLKWRIENRKEQLFHGFPDGLDLMCVCTEAGMGLDSAINRVGEEIKVRHPALSEELRLLSLELRAGKLRREALKNLAMRCDSDDIQSFATLLIQTEKFGTNVAQAMRVQADSMRTKRLQAIEEMAAKLPVKMLFPTILFIFPSLFLVLMGPALIQAWAILKG
jgi:tight adherence protein C